MATDVIDINEERLAFYYELGLAITQWAHVEAALSMVVRACFSRKDAGTHALGFFTIESFRAKLAYADSVVSTKFLGTAHMADWGGIRTKMGGCSIVRNKLAHYFVLNDYRSKAGRRIMLLPRYNAAKIKPREIRRKSIEQPRHYPLAICLRDIAKARLEFTALMARAENFSCRLQGESEFHSKSMEEPKAPPKLYELRRHLYEYAQRPPGSLKT